jgi:uncharacterized protein (TIGR00106 family)
MSVLMDFAVFPTDKGSSVSTQVARVVNIIKDSGFNYQLTSMGTIVETEQMHQALNIVEKAIKAIEIDSDRIYATIKFDIKRGAVNAINQKVKSIENKLEI